MGWLSLANPHHQEIPSIRVRGRKAVAQRKRRLTLEPLCRHCLARGYTTAATTPDHIIPLHKGGTDEDSNIQCLCESCHRTKTAKDMGYRGTQQLDADGWPTP
jgi:5-methylcytosine-specific restriction protein A